MGGAGASASRASQRAGPRARACVGLATFVHSGSRRPEKRFWPYPFPVAVGGEITTPGIVIERTMI